MASPDSPERPKMTAAWSQSPDRIRYQRFPMVRKGYDPEEVHVFLDHAAMWLEQSRQRVLELETALREARAGGSATGDPASGGPDDVATRVAGLYNVVDQHLQEVSREADRQAEERLAAAQEEASRIVLQAAARAGRLKDDAESDVAKLKSETEQAIQRLTLLRSSLIGELDELRGAILSLAGELGGQLDTLRAPPEAEPAPADDEGHVVHVPNLVWSERSAKDSE